MQCGGAHLESRGVHPREEGDSLWLQGWGSITPPGSLLLVRVLLLSLPHWLLLCRVKRRCSLIPPQCKNRWRRELKIIAKNITSKLLIGEERKKERRSGCCCRCAVPVESLNIQSSALVFSSRTESLSPPAGTPLRRTEREGRVRLILFLLS